MEGAERDLEAKGLKVDGVAGEKRRRRWGAFKAKQGVTDRYGRKQTEQIEKLALDGAGSVGGICGSKRQPELTWGIR